MESPSSPPLRSALLTFLVADFRGYTSYTAERGDEAAALLTSRFAELVDEVAPAHHGEVLELRGDEVLAVFSSARQALHAAVEIRRRFPVEIGQGTGVEVGIGVDAGDAVPVKGGYRTGALNLAARLQSLARGEVFASETVIALAGTTEGLAFVDRGEVRVKGRAAPVRVFEVGPEGELPSELPPLQPVVTAPPTNLPDDPTPFIGRQGEIEQIAGLLRDPHIRLVTLTGPGGTGKTRLALRVASLVLDHFQDGVFEVQLGSLDDPGLVPAQTAAVLGLTEAGGSSLMETLTEALKEKHLLLVLDNLEHLLDASSMVAHLLDACRRTHILVTSRIPLHLSREHEYPVSPLTVPDLSRLPDLADLARYESIALFVDRARATRPDFALTPQNAPAVAEICARLDGLPLAIALAAARIKLFPPQALLRRLESPLQVLTGGARDLPARQQTLRGALDWSYGLLPEGEQTLFRRLSVFAGGCTLDAADAVCASGEDLTIDLLDGVTSLIEKSLLRQEEPDGEPRFTMLRTIREYAQEKVEASGEADAIRRRHAEYYLAVAEEAEPGLDAWLAWCEREHDNLRTALATSIDAGDADTALRLSAAVSYFWFWRGHWSEGRGWLERALSLSASSERTRARGRALLGLGLFSRQAGDFVSTRAQLQESLDIAQEAGDAFMISMSLVELGMVALAEGDLAEARSLLERSLAVGREAGSTWAIVRALFPLGTLALQEGDFATARSQLEESVRLLRGKGYTSNVAYPLNALGDVARAEGDYRRATTYYEQSMELFDRLGNKGGRASVRHNLGYVALNQGDVPRARTLFSEALALSAELGDRRGMAECLVGLAGVAAEQSQPKGAARLLGAAERVLEEIGSQLPPTNQREYDRTAGRARAQLVPEAFESVWEEGRAMSLEEAVAYAQRQST